MFLRGAFCNHFPQKLKGLLVKVGLFLSFGAFACGYLKITACLMRDPYSFKQGFERFLKPSSTLIKQSLA
ncbi:hypothetical protein EC586_01015 [Helicobacter pylori]|nr:hypothetical protein ECC34_01140 [Helicobacter pylori]RVZ77034.1 hypothetical protein EC586_01015 [Helicobacter pylori]